MRKPNRPILRYHGGKWKLAPWIISHFPPHRVYTESYGGAANVLLQKAPSYAEVYNDMDGQIVNLFRVLRDVNQAHELVRLVALTPYARIEFEDSYLPSDDPVEQARRTLFRSMAGYSTIGATGTIKTGFRGNVTRPWNTPADNWRSFPDAMLRVIDRLRGVVIECSPALDVIGRYDGPDTLHYVDPTYPAETRSAKWAGKAYTHEMTAEDHRTLAKILHSVRGTAIVSGYACDLYDLDLYPDWYRAERKTHADGALDRVEVLWINRRPHPTLFDE